MDEWESIFTRRLDALGAAPDDLFDNEEEESPMFGVGPALMKHKFILEPENSPFKYVHARVRVCVHACVRACVRVCVCVRVRMCVCAWLHGRRVEGGSGMHVCV